MPKGPKGEKRPADLNQRAAMIVRIAAGEDADPEAAPHGQAGGLIGGKARSKKLSPEQRRAIARRGAQARWKAD